MNDIAEKHKKAISGIFNKGAQNYGSIGPNTFGYFGNKIVEHAELKKDDHVLDIACGRGASLFPAIERL